MKATNADLYNLILGKTPTAGISHVFLAVKVHKRVPCFCGVDVAMERSYCDYTMYANGIISTHHRNPRKIYDL